MCVCLSPHYGCISAEEGRGGVKGEPPQVPNKGDTWLGGDMQRETGTESVCVMVSTHGGCVMCWTSSVTAAIQLCSSSLFFRKPEHQT